MKTVFGRKNKSAVSPVIGTILMVAITVVLAAVLYVMVAGLGPGNAPQNVTMVLQGGSWNSGSLVFSVTSITQSNVDPTQLSYIVENGATTYYNGAAGLNTTTSGTATNVTFGDQLDVGHVSAGDKITLTVTPSTSTALRGGTLKVYFNNAAVSTATIP